MLFFAEASVTLLALERFLRIILKSKTLDGNTLYNLMEQANKHGYFKSLKIKDIQLLIKEITDVRNAILHGNFEQAAVESASEDVETYFKTKFIAEVEHIYQFLETLVSGIDTESGQIIK